MAIEKFMDVKFPSQIRRVTQNDFCQNVENCGRLECSACGFDPRNKEMFEVWREQQQRLKRVAIKVAQD